MTATLLFCRQLSRPEHHDLIHDHGGRVVRLVGNDDTGGQNTGHRCECRRQEWKQRFSGHLPLLRSGIWLERTETKNADGR